MVEYLLLIVKLGVRVLFRVRVKILNDVVALSLKQMVILVLAKVVMNLFSCQEAC
jgi:hypothetical protein